ncbi:MAG: histidinol-phosphate transaminase [Deltaproteobacteria bacterium]|nr:histidinol-phosphate transaminase [Deltaproteobacteria bacterium]
MKQLMRKCVETLKPYPPGKPIEELERELGIYGSIKLASNENPLGPSPMAMRAVRDNLENMHRYPDGSAYHLREKLAGKFGLPMSRIMVGNGADELIELVAQTFLSPGEEVLIPEHSFLLYETFVLGFDGKEVTVPLSDFTVDLQAIGNAVTSHTKIVFINNPQNPTGKAITRDEISRFLHDLPPDVIVVLDEAYIEFATDPGVVSGLEFLDSYPLLIVLRTFSKIYGLAGLRLGYGFASDMITDAMNRARQPFNVNSLAQVAAAAALDDEEFVTKTLILTREGLAYLYRELDRLGLTYIPTQANFLLIKTPLGARETYDRMLRQGVIIRPMDSYGLEDCIRVNVGLPEENSRFINALESIIA